MQNNRSALVILTIYDSGPSDVVHIGGFTRTDEAKFIIGGGYAWADVQKVTIAPDGDLVRESRRGGGPPLDSRFGKVAAPPIFV